MTVPDTRVIHRKAHIASLGFNRVKRVRLVDIYTIEKQFTTPQIKKIGDALSNPVTQLVYIDSFQSKDSFDWAIEIGFLPGVTDNVSSTAKECVMDLLKTSFGISENIYTSSLMLLSGSFLRVDVEKIALGFFNPLIERVSIKSFFEYKKDGGMDVIVPKVRLTSVPIVDSVNLAVSDEELVTIGKQGIISADGDRRGPLALDLPSMKAIQIYFKNSKRNPTDVELESIAQTWSEHCKHTIFSRPLDGISDGLYKHYIKRATEKIRKKLGKKDFCVSVFTDNSGAIAFDNKFLITHKVETHNSPSALDPFGGSITGIVGVNRDAIGFGLGAKPAANTFGFCFADFSDVTPLYKDKEKTHPLLSPKRIMDGVIAGVNSGGNCSGIPTPQGFLYFDPRYKGKPLVFVGTVGLIPNKKRLYEKRARSGDLIVMIGGRVGIDGIHGATFSSEALTSGSPATAVQIGDPITQKKLSDMLIKEARDMGLYTSITDNGAGGLSCSVAEMAKECGGFVVSLEKVPLKYPGLSPWQIWISESQERMTLSVPKSKWIKLKKLSESRGVEATVIGTFTRKSQCIVLYHKKIVMDMSMKFLHYGLPTLPQASKWHVSRYNDPKRPQEKELTDVLLHIVGRPNVSSFEWISSQYDHEVQGTSILKPLQGKGRVNADASVIRPVLASKMGIALSQALYPNYSDIDTYAMAASSIDTAIRNLVVVGADPDRIALIDNFCWCSSKDAFRLGQLKRAAKACYDYAIRYHTPFISGKDSMFNDFSGFNADGEMVKISIPPTLLISSIGLVDDVSRAVSLDVKCPGDLVYVLGKTFSEMGASEYFMYLSQREGNNAIGNSVPQADAKNNRKLYRTLHKAMQQGLVASAQSVTRGGLGIALVKTAIGGMLGMNIFLEKIPGSVEKNDEALFSESQGRVVVTIRPKYQKKFESIFSRVPYRNIGTVSESMNFTVFGLDGKICIDTLMKDLVKAYMARSEKEQV